MFCKKDCSLNVFLLFYTNNKWEKIKVVAIGYYRLLCYDFTGLD